MNTHPLVLVSATLLLAGCTATMTQPPASPASATPASGGGVVDAVARRLQNSLALVEIQMIQQDAEGGLATGTVTGVVVTADGKALIPYTLDAGRVHRIRAWIAGKEYPADFVRTDSRMGMTLIRIAPAAAPFFPIPASARPAPRRGEWVVALTASGEDTDFQTFADLSLVRGRLFQEFDRLLLSGKGFTPGTVVTDLDGALVGLVRSDEEDRAVAFSDLRARLDRLITHPAAADGGDEEFSKRKPWLGVMFEPINEDYAEACGLPKEAICVRAVFHDSPAERAGLRAEDLIVGVNGQPLVMKGPRALENFFKLFSPEVGREAKVGVLREGKPQTLTCRYERAPEPKDLKADDLGIQVREITDSVFHTSDLMTQEGVLVNEVIPGSPASTSNTFGASLISVGDAILELGGKPTPSLRAFADALDAVRRKGDPLVLVTLRSGAAITHAALNLKLKQSQRRTP